MDFQTRPANQFTFSELAQIFNRGFAGYFMPVDFTADAMQTFIQRDNIDLSASHILLADGVPAGVACIAHRPSASRLAGMGIAAPLRGQGAGSWLMERLLEEAHLRNDVHMELEVISQNEHAIKLYEKYGFKKLRRLVGFVCADPPTSSTSVPELCEIAAVAALVSAHSLPHLPWQVDGKTLLRLGTAPRAFHLNGAYAVTGNPSAEHVAIRCLIVEPDVRRQGRALALLRALFAAYPGKTWHIPQIFPEEMAGVFEKAGFAAETLSQLQMKLQF